MIYQAYLDQYWAMTMLKHMKYHSNQMQPEDGTFAEYIMVKGDVQMASPSNDVESATLGVGIATVGML